MESALANLASVVLTLLGVGVAGLILVALVGNVGGAVRRDMQTRRDGKPGPVPVTWTKPRG